MSAVQDPLNDENGTSIVVNKATKLRRLPLSRRQGNVIVLSISSTNSAFKLNKPISPAKIRKNPVNKLSENGGAENIGDWSTLSSKGSSHEKAPKIFPAQQSSSSLGAEELSDVRPSIFRQLADYDDRDETMVLKRANPVYDSDEEDDIVPLKRRRTLDGNTTLQLDQPLQNTSDSLSSMFWFQE